MEYLKLFVYIPVVYIGVVLVFILAGVFFDHLTILLLHFAEKRTWAKTREIFKNLWIYHYWWKISDFYPRIRARVLFRWSLSSLGKKVDLYLINKRKDEFHFSLNTDIRILMYLNKKEKETYNNNLMRRRQIAHDLDLHEPHVSPIN